MRVWLKETQWQESLNQFQLTHPWGCDLVWIWKRVLSMPFQLTHPWGCDIKIDVVPGQSEISTHTPVRVWQAEKVLEMHGKISTHTPVRVWQRRTAARNARHTISTHTPVRVWLSDSDHGGWPILDFNSHTREGVTTCTPCYIRNFKFQLTHPWGCDVR